ncbi:ferredoxin--NADP(+) reductase [Buchnera aphidicola]|uniref:Flavodoxin/ferredoxin--NADP reductase n=1 Tax=Buchnera aphidicola (Anoecia oenotherae) TaxID=1241833 RepID=A0A4D6XRC5_9GAMM|nr:ferredoxin--NADP(+) reductase [Buchnera aphidicola]QCI19563.1 ferredoxin--NADP(+) reductase [Buchnera aphidicola (Anoecia oenotherae)]
MSIWTTAKIIRIKKWTDQLFTVFMTAKIDNFIAGQFSKISILTGNTKRIQRAYSYVNPPNNNILEFYISRISEGCLSPTLYSLKPKDKVFITKKSFGCFTLNNISSCKILWMIATGTAIGPYLSILQQKNEEIKKFKHIILIHAVRYSQDLTYSSTIQKLEKIYYGKLIFKSIVSREKTKASLFGRIPNLLINQQLEKSVNYFISPHTSHVMLCGNPNMVKETCDVLQKNYKMKKNFKKNHGNISSENYW